MANAVVFLYEIATDMTQCNLKPKVWIILHIIFFSINHCAQSCKQIIVKPYDVACIAFDARNVPFSKEITKILFHISLEIEETKLMN